MVHSVSLDKEKNSECKMSLFLRRWSPYKWGKNFFTVRLANSYVDVLKKNYVWYSKSKAGEFLSIKFQCDQPKASKTFFTWTDVYTSY